MISQRLRQSTSERENKSLNSQPRSKFWSSLGRSQVAIPIDVLFSFCRYRNFVNFINLSFTTSSRGILRICGKWKTFIDCFFSQNSPKLLQSCFDEIYSTEQCDGLLINKYTFNLFHVLKINKLLIYLIGGCIFLPFLSTVVAVLN